MDPLSRTNRNAPVNSEIQSNTEQPASPAKSQPGIANTNDSFESSKVDSFRTAYLAGKSEGKVIMSDASMNHVLQSGLTPKQYPEAFKDFKGFVKTNFALTPDQNATLNRLPESEVRKFQDAGALAAKLDKPLHYQSKDLDPSLSGPKDMKFLDPMIEDHGISIRAECARPEVAINPNIFGQ